MAPSDTMSDAGNAEATADLMIWNRALPTPGRVFGPSAGVTLPSGAVRAADAAWVSAERMAALKSRPTQEQFPFAHLVPEFIIEVMSSTDSMARTHKKMEEWIEAGVLLGLMIDRKRRKVHIYRPDTEPEERDNPAEISGEPELPGFILNMKRVFE